MTEIVTLTGFPDIFTQFQNSVETFEPLSRRTVVTSRGFCPRVARPESWTVVKGVDPFVFARNANLGFTVTGDKDVLLVNDDVQFTRANSLRDLESIMAGNPSIGILSPQVMGCVGNPLQSWQQRVLPGLTTSRERLAFVCVFIRRAVIDTIGPMDERFNGYGGDDDDYSIRAQAAGFTLAITPDVVVRHGYGRSRSSSSFARTMGNTASSMASMREQLRRKMAALK